MFAPKLSKPLTKTPEVSTSGLGPGRSTLATPGFDRNPVAQARFLQRTIGNQATQRLLAPHASNPDEKPSFSPSPARFAGAIQTKLEIGTVDDPLEREADRMAEKIMRMPNAAIVAPSAGTVGEIPGMQRQSTGQQSSGPASTPSNAATAAPPIVHEVLRSPGSPLDNDTRNYMESRFAADFNDVRVHTDSQAAESAAAIGARAYTVGKNVVFGAGRFAPASQEGKRLLAHELTHVLQQGEARRGTNGAEATQPPLPLAPDSITLHRASGTVLRREPKVDDQNMKLTQDATLFHPDEIEGSKHTYYRGVYKDGPDLQEVYWVKFNVDDKGVMTASVRTVSANKENRSGQLRFGAEFNKALETFKKDGVEVTAFEADWSYMSPDEISDNLRIFQEGVKGELTKEEAANSTPTGKVVTKAGFKFVGVTEVSEPQTHLKVELPRVKAMFRRVVPTPDVPSGGTGGGGKQPTQAGKAPAGTDVEPGVEGKTGGTKPAQKTTGQAPASGRSSGLAIQVGTGVATLGLEWLAAYLRMKVDAKIAQRQKEAFLAIAAKKINANPDEAVKTMLVNPNRTVYAWIHLENTVITSVGVDPVSGDPTLNNSSPLFDLGPIEYVSAPVPQELVNSFPNIGGGGSAPRVTRTTIIDVSLKTPPLEELVSYAKTRNMPLDDVYAYALGQLQAAASSDVSVLETRLSLLQAHQAGIDAWKKLDAEYKEAEKRHDLKRQVAIFHALASRDQSQLSLSAQINSIEKKVQQSSENVQYWQHILDLIKPAMP